MTDISVATEQTIMRVEHDPNKSSKKVSSVYTSADSDPTIQHAINEIFSTYGVNVSVEEKKKSLLKFGRNTNVGSDITGYTIWATGVDQAHETYAATNTNPIQAMSSGSTIDVGIPMKFEGHTESGGNKTFLVSPEVTLNGLSLVSLPTGYNRLTRAFNSGATNLTGPVYFYENTAITNGKPDDTTKIHLTLTAGTNQSQKASTSLSSQDYWIITRIYGSVIEKTANIISDLELQARHPGGVFRQVADIGLLAGEFQSLEFRPYVIVPANSDIRLVAVSSTTGVDMSGGIEGYLAIVV